MSTDPYILKNFTRLLKLYLFTDMCVCEFLISPQVVILVQIFSNKVCTRISTIGEGGYLEKYKPLNFIIEADFQLKKSRDNVLSVDPQIFHIAHFVQN